MEMVTDLPPKTHNNPPKTIFETIGDLCLEAENWLDGKPIETDEQAAGLGRLMDMLTAARKTCEAERKEKVAPIDEARKAIQDVYVPAIENAGATLACAQTARNKWLRAKQAELNEAARAAREGAAEALRIAQEAMQTRTGSLADAQAAEALVDMAKSAEINARIAAKATPAKIGGRRTVTKKWEAALVDMSAAAGYYYKSQPARMAAFLIGLAEEEVRLGKREIPGFLISEMA